MNGSDHANQSTEFVKLPTDFHPNTGRGPGQERSTLPPNYRVFLSASVHAASPGHRRHLLRLAAVNLLVNRERVF
jgi:hypothetical protein